MKLLETTAIAILAVFTPIAPMLSVALVLIFADLVTGLLAARKKGESIKSSGINRTVSKIVITLAALCLGFLVEKYMLDEIIPLSKMIAGVVGLKELKSILENCDVLNGGSLFKSVIKKIGSINDKMEEDVKKEFE